jgi:large subunit ribosomal protein L24
VEGEGATPRALIGSLNGTGTVSLEKAEIAKLDPKVFSGAMRAVDQGMALEAGKLRDFVAPALDGGRLTLKDAEGAIAIVNGQARLGTVIAKGEGADLSASGSLDLATLALDGRLILTATNAPAFAGRPELTIGLKGTFAAPRREIDVSALAGWLALRAVDQQSKKLEQIEAERTGRAVPRPSPVTTPAAPTPIPNTVAPLPAPLEIKPAPRAAAPLRQEPARQEPMRPDPQMTDRDRFFNSQR